MPKPRSGSLKRKTNIREQKETLLIVCEGEETEPNYFRSFRVTTARVMPIGTGYNTITVVDEAIRLKNGANPAYDQVWAVFDKDSFPAHNFNTAIQRAHANGIHVAYSNEAFEMWYILHFNLVNASLSRTQYQGILRGYLGAAYQKND